MDNSIGFVLGLKSYKSVFNEYYFSLCVFSDKYVNDLDLSKDIVQEVFITVWNKEICFKSKAALKSFLYKSVRNKSLDFLKSKEYRTKVALLPSYLSKIESDSYFEKEVLVEEIYKTIDDALDTLPKKCKEIMKMSLDGLCNSQISEELSISTNTVKAQKRIAFQKLRPLLKEASIATSVLYSLFF